MISDLVLGRFAAGSSTDVSEDWEKDFDLDMTEEEVQIALAKADATAEVPPLTNNPLRHNLLHCNPLHHSLL